MVCSDNMEIDPLLRLNAVVVEDANDEPDPPVVVTVVFPVVIVTEVFVVVVTVSAVVVVTVGAVVVVTVSAVVVVTVSAVVVVTVSAVVVVTVSAVVVVTVSAAIVVLIGIVDVRHTCMGIGHKVMISDKEIPSTRLIKITNMQIM